MEISLRKGLFGPCIISSKMTSLIWLLDSNLRWRLFTDIAASWCFDFQWNQLPITNLEFYLADLPRDFPMVHLLQNYLRDPITCGTLIPSEPNVPTPVSTKNDFTPYALLQSINPNFPPPTKAVPTSFFDGFPYSLSLQIENLRPGAGGHLDNLLASWAHPPGVHIPYTETPALPGHQGQRPSDPDQHLPPDGPLPPAVVRPGPGLSVYLLQPQSLLWPHLGGRQPHGGAQWPGGQPHAAPGDAHRPQHRQAAHQNQDLILINLFLFS